MSADIVLHQHHHHNAGLLGNSYTHNNNEDNYLNYRPTKENSDDVTTMTSTATAPTIATTTTTSSSTTTTTAATINTNASDSTHAKSRREVVALDGYMFDTSLLRDHDVEILDSSSSNQTPTPESTVDILSSTLALEFQNVKDDPTTSPVETSSVTSNESVTVTESQEDNKDAQIEAEDPPHLFWVPFHRHPEIAPNEYNTWLSQHGVDSSGSGSILAARKESINRRKSVLSTQYNPDDEEDEDVSMHKNPEHAADKQSDENQQPVLLESCLEPMGQTGESLLNTKASLRRSSSHTQNTHAQSPEEDLAAAKRGSGLTRHGPSLLRRSARTKIRRDSNASSEIKNDTSRLRSELIHNGEYPAVTLVDPGPIPLSSSSSSSPLESDTAKTDILLKTEPTELVQKPLKRFVSTLRDSSKPTITTYIEPQLLEQCQKEIEDAESSSKSLKTLTMLTIADVSNTSPPSSTLSKELSSDLSYEDVVTSKVTYPIPPPVKMSQNLLQQPVKQLAQQPTQPIVQQSEVISVRLPLSAQTPTKSQIIPENQQSSSGGTPNSKKLSWSWPWGKEKGGGKTMEVASRLNQKSSTVNSQQHLNNNGASTETLAKKPSALSSLFSRNGKNSSKAQTSTTGAISTPGGSPGKSSIQEDYLNDPSRMPIHIERAIYRMSHIKLADPRRPLHEQVQISNMMFWYLGVVQQQQLEQQNADVQQQQLLQPQQQQQSHILPEDRAGGHAKLDDKESIQEISAKQKALKKKKSQQDVLISESKVEGSEYIVPQQDSNSHARSPCKDIATGITHVQSFLKPTSREDADYDEESMIGGGFSADFDWDEEEENEQKNHLEGRAGSLYLQEVTQDISSYTRSIEGDASHRRVGAARGPKKHLKRLNAPKHWMLDKLTGTYAPRPTAGPHKLRECLPLVILLRNRLKYALNGKEVQSILMQRLVKVDGKVRTDSTFPAGFMDAISIEKTGENFRLVYDTKGRFTVHRITAEEA
ncbi:40S ribosomal protein S4, partial [Haplosporangium sp. Z 27]